MNCVWFSFFGLIFTQNQLEIVEKTLLDASLTELATELAASVTYSQIDLLLDEEEELSELELFFELLLASTEDDELLEDSNFFSSSSKSFFRALFC